MNDNIRVTFLDDYTKSVKNISDENNVDMDILKVLESSIKDAIQCSSDNVKRMATSYASFPSWRMSGVSKAYFVKGYVCIWRKEPFIGINADRRNWEYALGKEKYRARVEELKKTKYFSFVACASLDKSCTATRNKNINITVHFHKCK